MIFRSFAIGALLLQAGLAHAASAQSYSDVKAIIERIANANPKTCQLVDIGASDSGDTIKGLRIGSGPVNKLVVATHHGNEYGSTEVALAFALAVAKNPIPDHTIWVVPVLNIDGFNHRDRYENRFDPNRDYPGPCGTEGPFRLKSTQALASFIERAHIVASATLHTFFPAVTYPWGISTQDLVTPYTSVFERMASDATKESGYQTGNSTSIIYPADGSFEDYAYWKLGIWSVLFEIGETHSPNDTDIEHWNAVNVPGLRRMLTNAPKTRAVDHAFRGKCDPTMRMTDMHVE